MNAAAENANSEEFKNPQGKILSVAHKGDWRNYPENSAEGILSCAGMGINIVEINIRKTKDGALVLFADESVERTCVNNEGKPAKGAVHEMTLKEIQSLKLRTGRGGEGSAATPFSPPVLEAALEAAGEKCLLLIDAPWELKDDIYAELERLEKTENAIFRFGESAKNIENWLKEKNPVPQVIGRYKGNIVFLAASKINRILGAGGVGVELASSNPYGVVFGNFIMKRFHETGRAMVSMINPAVCGGREDNESGWNDMISKGYSVIETDYPRELADYIEKTNIASQKLASTIEAARAEMKNKEFSKDFLNIVDAAETVSKKGNASFAEIEKTYLNLRNALDDIENHSLQSAAPKITAGKITAAALCTAGIIAAQTFFFKKRKKAIM